MKTKHTNTFEWSADILFVTAHGTTGLESFIEMIHRTAQEVHATKTKGVFLDIRDLSGKFGVIDRYHAGVAGANSRLCIPVAVVGHEPMIDPQRFGEIVARNRGLNVRVFTDIMKAITWLSKFRKVQYPEIE